MTSEHADEVQASTERAEATGLSGGTRHVEETERAGQTAADDGKPADVDKPADVGGPLGSPRD